MKAKLSLLILLFQILFVSCSSSDDQVSERAERGFDQEQIDELNASERFDYDKEIDRKSNPVLEAFSNFFSFLGSVLFNTAGYIFLGLILILIVWLIIKGAKPPPIERKIDAPDVKLVNEEELENTDYIPLLEKAIKEGNFRLAIRFSFILALQNLQRKGRIQWHKEKTNYQYLMELPLEMQQTFSSITRIYEYVWYGEVEANKELYQQIQSHLSNLKNSKSA